MENSNELRSAPADGPESLATSRDPLAVLSKSSVTTAVFQELVEQLGTDRKAGDNSVSDNFSPAELASVGAAALEAFLQANVTGPVLSPSLVSDIEKQFLEAWSTSQGNASQFAAGHGKGTTLNSIQRVCLKGLEVDGVSPYAYIPHIELFSLAHYIFLTKLANVPQDIVDLSLPQAKDTPSRSSISWMKLRIHVWHYKLLTQPSLGPGSNFTRSSQWSDVPTLADLVTSSINTVRNRVVGDEVWSTDSAWSTDEKTLFLLEAANAYVLIGRSDSAQAALKEAARSSGLLYALSGALGKRTKFQEKSISQLVVLAKSRDGSEVAKEADADVADEETAKPDALQLNDDTLLESISFNKDKEAQESHTKTLPAPLAELSPDEQPQLSPLDQIILLTEATFKDAFSPLDALTSEEVLPFAVRVLADKSTNWQIYTQALLVRSRIEVHRSRTMERGVLQLQAVADQVLTDTTNAGDEKQQKPDADGPDKVDAPNVPSIQISTPDREAAAPAPDKPTTFFPAVKAADSAPADVRLKYIHALSTPPRWHLESELAYAWAGIGSLVSALEIFKRLRLWAEVALCLASAAALDDEDGRGSGGEEKARGIIRWRLFHRSESDASSPVDADGEGVSDPTTLKASDFSGPERTPPPPNAPRLWCILGDLEDEPSHYERAWTISQKRFARAQKSLGEYYLRQKDLVKAQEAYKKATAVNRLSPEMWGRLGDISLRLAQFDDAADAYGRSIGSATDQVGGEDARTWSNLGSALWSLYLEVTAPDGQDSKAASASATGPARTADDTEEGDEEEPASHKETDPRDPSTLLAKSLAAYKKGASIAHDNWRIWDNVLTLASRVHPPDVPDMILAISHVLRIRKSEDAVDAAVLRGLLHTAVLSKDKPAPQTTSEEGASSSVYEPPRGSEERLVMRLLEEQIVPLITRRAELWTLVSRLRAWRNDYPGAVDASERAWRAAMGSTTSSSSSGLLPGSSSLSSSAAATTASGEDGVGGGDDWTNDQAAWDEVVLRTDELVSALENWGPEGKWKGKARSAVRSVMGRGRERWEDGEGWKILEGLMEGLKTSR